MAAEFLARTKAFDAPLATPWQQIIIPMFREFQGQKPTHARTQIILSTPQGNKHHKFSNEFQFENGTSRRTSFLEALEQRMAKEKSLNQ